MNAIHEDGVLPFLPFLHGISSPKWETLSPESPIVETLSPQLAPAQTDEELETKLPVDGPKKATE